MNQANKARILVVDDEQDILNSYQKILQPRPLKPEAERLNELESRLFAAEPDKQEEPICDIDLCLCGQGPEAVAQVEKSLRNNNPFAVAFLDVRMPPGPDGIWTAEQIRKLDPQINIIIVTAYSDITPSEIAVRVLPPERLLYMQKPFHSHEIKQFVSALTAKWYAEKELLEQNIKLDQLVKDRTGELRLTVDALEKSNLKYRETNESLQITEKELLARTEDLSGAKNALQQLSRQHEEERRETEKKVLFTVHEMVGPYLDSMEQSGLDEMQASFLKIVRSNLEEIVSPFMKKLSYKYFRLSPTEINIANLIKEGNTTKEITELLNMTKRNVDFHRDQIREKIGIKNTKANLKNVLKELEVELTK